MQRGIAALGMKPICGRAEPIKKGVFTADRNAALRDVASRRHHHHWLLRYGYPQQNLEVAQGFTPLIREEMQALRDRARPYAGDSRFELYKTSLKFDNPEARLAHAFPLDMKSVEVKQMVEATQNTGRPFPEISQ